ncbi:MAG: carbon starvation protein [Bacillota bacterium]|nr:carbon starvation protein [Bacillota bacterium]MDK2856300.1 carbon starvation protein [Bacillota bacterium]MDK2925602.1 carbon starvation protein [Bacillota bacterium]
MSTTLMVVIGAVILFIGYVFYGRYLAEKVLKLDPNAKTPAHAMYDGVDYVPAPAPVLLGHHFASIAGAGPITGPVAAAVFGWVPVFLWIVFGSVFFGGVHDFSALVASVRHEGKSIGEIVRRHIGERGQFLFLCFSYLALVLVVAVFTILVVQTFVAVPAVATTSLLFMVLAVAFGLSVYRAKLPLGPATVVGVVLLFTCVYLGVIFPIKASAQFWTYFCLAYIFVAATLPVWILLQPRDYLNSFLLYATLFGALLGLIIGNPSLRYPAYTAFNTSGGYLFPMLFVTVACGAISGFHSLVSSGTTSKQLANEKDARVVGYGAMLIEGLLALVALSTVAYLTKEGYAQTLKEMGGPTGLFAAGVGQFMNYFGIPVAFGTTFGALALNAFCLTSLDTATRLARYAWEEFFSTRIPALANRYLGTLATVILAGALALSGSWKEIWPIFGASNQLLAGLALLSVSVWLAGLGRDNRVTLYPMMFMVVVTLTALGFLIRNNLAKGNLVLGVPGILLFVLAVFLVVEAVNALGRIKKAGPNISA